MTQFYGSDRDPELDCRWRMVALQNPNLGWDWRLDADTAAVLKAARDAGRVLTAQQRDPLTGRMVLLAKLAGSL